MNIYFGRTELLLGQGTLEFFANARVAIFGLGGVGSYAAEALARSAIGYLRLIDFDTVGASNFNRQIFALHSTLGKPKVTVAAARLRDINPAIIIDERESFFAADSADELLAAPLDFVIDAIDSLGPKCELISQCLARDIPFISAMGSSARMDPTAIRIGTIWETSACPLARKVRRVLRRKGISADVPVIYSTELAGETFLAAELGEQTTGTLQRGRERRIIPSIATLPGIVGLMAANVALQKLHQRAEIINGN